MKKMKGLGQGLSALLPSVDDLHESSYLFVDINHLTPGSYQPRSHIHSEQLETLASSIKEQGLIQPIVVRKTSHRDTPYEIIAGERRWRASAMAGLSEVPVIIREASNQEMLAIGLIENIQREALDPIEEAHGILRLTQEFGLTHENLAALLGRSRTAISNILRLLQLPLDIQDLIHQGLLSMGHARALLALPEDERLNMAQVTIDQQLSVRQVEDRIKKTLIAKKTLIQPSSAKTGIDTVAIQATLTQKIRLPIEIKSNSKGHGRIIINYKSQEDIEYFLSQFQT
jgi:ParB family chromosome partitioning protein